MDLDFDDESAAPAARAGAKFKPRGRPQPKKKQAQTTLSTDVAKEKLSTQSEHPVSLDASSAYPSNVSTSETTVPDSGTISQSTMGTISKENVSGGASVLRACTNLNSEGKKCEDDTETAPAYPDDPRRQDSAAFGDFVTSETDEVIDDQTQRMQTEEEEECDWNMETLDIVQEECVTSAYEQHTGKFQPKPRLLDTVIEEEPESHYSVDDDTTGANPSEFMVNEESRNDEFNINTTFHGDHQEDEHNIPEQAPNVLEQEHHVVSPSNNDTVMGEGETQANEAETGADKKGKKKRGRKKKTTTSEEEPNKPPPETKKKFKHSSRRQKNTLDKELLETPDDEIKHLPIRDMLRLVAYRESLEKKEAKGAPVVPPTQERYYTNNTHASEDNHYYSQGFDAEDEFGMEEGENHEAPVVKPDSPVNYQTYMNKTPRTRWSKQDTQLFYEGIQEFGSNLSMVQQLFPERTRQQIKLKYKLEERKNPLKLNDALSTRSKKLTHYHNVIKKLQEEAAAAKEGEEEEEEGEEAGEEAETTTDVPESVEPTKTEETERDGGVAGVKESDGGDVENGVISDGGDEIDDNEGDDDDFWNSYKSEM
ncbi:glutamic acid-rich protein isoform X2 [Brassica rapa]|uniref:glutamic acid-rich protein isoform X2 n=1 Tax=Brassica campestris TaxID=3711 RepID=UPI00142D44C8|nr:glutamic acid-rich protein isoform X2 [Brassica rapa]